MCRAQAIYLRKKQQQADTDTELVEPFALCINVHLSHVRVLQDHTHNNRKCISTGLAREAKKLTLALKQIWPLIRIQFIL